MLDSIVFTLTDEQTVKASGNVPKQAEKLKSCKKVKDEGWMMKDEGWLMKDEGFKLFVGFADWQTDKWTLVIVESLLRLK